MMNLRWGSRASTDASMTSSYFVTSRPNLLHDREWQARVVDFAETASFFLHVRSVLGIIYHKISKNTNDPLTLPRLYTALVRPHLEHAAQVWNPYLEKDIQCIENVQKFALRICAKDYTASYVHLLDVFLLPSLKNRRLYLSYVHFTAL